MPPSCSMCERMAKERARGTPYLIHEFPLSYFIVGDHQYHRGYSLLVLKRHVRELHELPPAEQEALNRELMAATAALVATFSPWKMNHACLGNTDEHVHWHLFPRYESDPDHHGQPWKRSELWKDHLIAPEAARTLAVHIREHLPPLG